MRIVGGRWAGRDLTSPGGRVRPTAEQIRVHWMELLGTRIEGARVLELYAGTGAVGLEALSRGARYADFVENNPAALHALKANVAALRATSRTRIFKQDAIRYIGRLPAAAYDVALADPPYGTKQAELVVERWLDVPFAGTLALEHAAGHRLPRAARTTVFGDSALSLYTGDAG